MTRINPGNHPMQRATQAHFTYRAIAYFEGEADDTAFFEWRRDHHVNIGHDVWIGHGAIVLPGRNVGTGAVIAAGAIVTRDVPPYTIVAGNPARIIRPRFSGCYRQRLVALRWWDWSHERCAARCPISATSPSRPSSKNMRMRHPGRSHDVCHVMTNLSSRAAAPCSATNCRTRPRCGYAGRDISAGFGHGPVHLASTRAICWCCLASSISMATPSSGR